MKIFIQFDGGIKSTISIAENTDLNDFSNLLSEYIAFKITDVNTKQQLVVVSSKVVAIGELP